MKKGTRERQKKNVEKVTRRYKYRYKYRNVSHEWAHPLREYI